MFFRTLLLLSAGMICAKPASQAEVTHKLLLEFSINGNVIKETITVGLFGKETPKTGANFYHLCAGEIKTTAGQKLSIVNSPFHRIIPGFMIQGGDFTNENGTGGISVFGSKFADENFNVNTEIGVLAMANSGPNTNGSQFFITTGPTDWLNGKHVVFGRVVKGMETVKMIERYGSSSGTPSANIRIASCKYITP